MGSMMNENQMHSASNSHHLEHTYSTKGNIETMAQITPAELAERWETDPKTVRRFLRSLISKDERPGKGRRWALSDDSATLDALTERFNAWRNKATKVISVDDLTETE